MQGKYVATCVGIYTLTTNIIIRADAGTYTLAVLLNDIKSVTAVAQITRAGSITTLSIYQSMRWSKGTVITLQLTSSHGNPITVLKSSSWSMSFIGEQTGSFKEFAVFAPDNIMVPPSQNALPNFDPLKINLGTVENNLKDTTKPSRGQFILPTGLSLNELSKFEVSSSDLFYVTATVHVAGEATDVEVVVTVSEEETNDNLGEKGLSGRFSKPANSAASITLGGIMFAQKLQFISVYVASRDNKNVNITSDSFLSIINMRYIVSNFGARLSADEVISTNNWVEVKQNWLVQGSDLYAFGKDFDNTNGRFRASHSGIHMIHANVHFDLPSNVIANANNQIYATIVVDGLQDADVGENGFYSTIKGSKTLASLRVYGIMNLRAGQFITLRVKSDSASPTDAYRLIERTSLTVSYIGPKWAVPSFYALTQFESQYSATNKPPIPFNKWRTAKLTATTPFITDTTMFDGTYFTSPEDAIYAITASMVILRPSCSGSTYFFIKLVTSDTANLFTNIDIGMSDQKYVLGGSGRTITLTISTAVRLKQGEKLGIQLGEEIALTSKCSYTVSPKSSFSVVRWSSYSNPSWNSLQNVGFFARTTSDTTVTSSRWERLGSNILRTDKVNPRPGYFEIGPGFSTGTASYTVQAPAIFLVSGSIRLRGSTTSNSILNGVYQVGIDIDSGTVDTGLYAQITQSSSEYVVLTFAGTIYVSKFQVIRVVVHGSGDNSYFIDALSSFTMIKLQPDVKTPGIILEDTQTLSTTGLTQSLTSWDAENKLGLTQR